MSEQTHRHVVLGTGRTVEQKRRDARWLAAFVQRKGTTPEYMAKVLAAPFDDVKGYITDGASEDKWDRLIPLSWEKNLDTMTKRSWAKGKLNNENDFDVPFKDRARQYQKDLKAKKGKKARKVKKAANAQEPKKRRKKPGPKKGWKTRRIDEGQARAIVKGRKIVERSKKSPTFSSMIPAPVEERLGDIRVTSGILVTQGADGVLQLSAFSNIPAESLVMPFRFEHNFTFTGAVKSLKA